jgi:GT2 family glycosyltransferase
MGVKNSISVILHTYYRYECLETVLRLLSDQTLKPLEVVISDQTPLNDRPTGFYKKFKELPLKVINLEKPTHAPAQNRGARASKGDILLFLDDDIEFNKDLLEQHVTVMEEENVDVVMGVVSGLRNLPDSSNRNTSNFDPISIFLKGPHSRWNGMALHVHGLNTSIRREIFLESGGFDEKIPRMADIELGYRLFRSGAKIYHSEKPFVYHKRWHKGGTRKTQSNINYIRLISRFYLYKKHFPGWGTYQFLLLEILNALLFRAQMRGEFQPKSLKNPFLPVIRLCRILRAWVESNRLLKY